MGTQAMDIKEEYHAGRIYRATDRSYIKFIKKYNNGIVKR